MHLHVSPFWVVSFSYISYSKESPLYITLRTSYIYSPHHLWFPFTHIPHLFIISLHHPTTPPFTIITSHRCGLNNTVTMLRAIIQKARCSMSENRKRPNHTKELKQILGSSPVLILRIWVKSVLRT